MILTHKQDQRLIGLLFDLAAYAAREFGLRWSMDIEDPQIDDLFRVYARIWGPDGNREVIDKYLKENPRRLKWADLKEVRSWREALFGRFHVVRDGSDVFYLAGDYAFAVRGVLEEADVEENVKLSFVESLVLPFDGVITLGVCARELILDRAKLPESERRAMLADCREAGRVIRGARQFAQSSEAVREYLDAMAPAGEDMSGASLERELQRGRLAGLTWEERERVADEQTASMIGDGLDQLVTLELDSVAVRGLPAQNFKELLSRKTKEHLLTLADRFGANATPKMSKARLVDEVIRVMPTEAEDLLGPAMMAGPDEFAEVRRIFEAGGRIDVDASDTEGLGKLPTLSYPAVSIYRTRHGYAAAMVQETIDELKTLGPDGFDALARRTEDLELACRYASVVADFRGMVPAMDVALDCVRQLEIEESFFSILVTFQQRKDIFDGFGMVEIDGESVIVSSELAAAWEADDLVEDADLFAETILDAHEDYEARPLARLVLESDYWTLFDYLYDQQPFRDLLQYLDEHVPEGEDDIFFADKLLADSCPFLCLSDPDDVTVDTLFDAMERCGFRVPDEDEAYVERLADELLRIVPNWFLNGWPAVGSRLELV